MDVTQAAKAVCDAAQYDVNLYHPCHLGGFYSHVTEGPYTADTWHWFKDGMLAGS
jgi:hypothetical protein